MKRVGVIIAAAGSGQRMGGVRNKVLLPLAGLPVIVHSLRLFSSMEWVSSMVVVCRTVDRAEITRLVDDYAMAKVERTVTGGARRQESVYQGLQALPEDTEYVFIHDAARPLVDREILERTWAAVQESAAVGVGVPVKDTIKVVDSQGFIQTTPPRDGLWAIQTPQAFTYSLIMQTYEQAQTHQWEATDDCGLVERTGRKVRMVYGSYENIKITTPEDIPVAESMLREQERVETQC